MVETGENQGVSRLLTAPSISESSGNPKQKKSRRACEIELRPLFTGQLFIVREGLLWRDSREATGSASKHARLPIVSGSDTRQGGADSHRFFQPTQSLAGRR